MTERLDISTKHCTIEREGRVVIFTMNRPEKKNALSPDMLAGLVLGYEYVDDDPEIRCAILTGAGGNFCSGMDLTSMGQQSDDPNVQAVMARGNNPHWKALLRDYRLSKPLIAAVEGYAVAGGSEILQGTDIRVAGESAIFGVWEAKRGLFPLGGSACRLPRQIPYTLAMDILLRCPPVPAPEAREIGLIGHVVPDGQALTKALEIAEQINNNGPLAVEAILRTLRETDGMTEKEALAHEFAYGQAVFASEDAKEGPKAFAEKRTPNFQRR